MKALEVKQISKIFHTKDEKTKRKLEFKAVDEVSFSADYGEIYGLLGANGAGKTTTLRMVSTLLKPDGGEIFIGGIDAIEDSMKAKLNIGFLTSEMKLEEYFSPNYIFSYFSKLYQIPEDEAAMRKKRLFSDFGINQYADKKISCLSTGMKQKISLVISIINDPDIIIFDEPTNGLDIVASKIVKEFLLKLKSQGKCIILSTHIFNLIEDLCDRVGIMINGKVVYTNEIKGLNDKKLEEIFFDQYEKNGGIVL